MNKNNTIENFIETLDSNYSVSYDKNILDTDNIFIGHLNLPIYGKEIILESCISNLSYIENTGDLFEDYNLRININELDSLNLNDIPDFNILSSLRRYLNIGLEKEENDIFINFNFFCDNGQVLIGEEEFLIPNIISGLIRQNHLTFFLPSIDISSLIVDNLLNKVTIITLFKNNNKTLLTYLSNLKIQECCIESKENKELEFYIDKDLYSKLKEDVVISSLMHVESDFDSYIELYMGYFEKALMMTKRNIKSKYEKEYASFINDYIKVCDNGAFNIFNYILKNSDFKIKYFFYNRPIKQEVF